MVTQMDRRGDIVVQTWRLGRRNVATQLARSGGTVSQTC